MRPDQQTADAFANSWNHMPPGSAYTTQQFEDWFSPVARADVAGGRVLELGCGNASLLVHMAEWSPVYLEGVDLGDSVKSARDNMSRLKKTKWRITQDDLTTFAAPERFDLVYCIGVLHHLKEPRAGFKAVIRNVKDGGRFHCWVYAKEGNAVVIHVVDPIRKIACRLPWWITKYLIAAPLALPYYFYAKLLSLLRGLSVLRILPLYEYSLWIATREFSFCRQVAFDQLVTPQTVYIDRDTIKTWLEGDREIDPASFYIIMRNGNSWKFGGKVKRHE